MDEVANQCGFFEYDFESNANNGYLCNHPDSEDGECHRKGCPVAVVVNEDADLFRLLEK